MQLSNPQYIYLKELDTKFRAYVGGFGCVHPDTKIHTEYGLMRICEINRPMRVLSYNHNKGQFQYSLSGGSFPKGVDYLYQVTTKQGEFVSSGHHRIFSSNGKYECVYDLKVGDEVYTCSDNLDNSILDADQKLSLLNVQNYSQTDVNLMGHYANVARQYGQQLLKKSNIYSNIFPLPTDVQTCDRLNAPCDQQELGQSHNHLYQLFDRICKMGFFRPFVRLFSNVVNQIEASFFERISHYHSKVKLFALKFLFHRKVQQQPFAYHSYSRALSKTTITSIVKDNAKNSYWDMQVLDTNNYVTEDGVIHHNSGKTFVGCLDLIIFAGSHPKTIQGYFSPNYGLIRDIFYPTFTECAEMMGYSVKINTSNKEVTLYKGNIYYGTIICRSMDNPNTIVGFKIARALVDEIDLLDVKKASLAWRKIIARMRLTVKGARNDIGVTTTPEGFKFVYDKFGNNPKKNYSMVQASTYENEDYLPPDYIDTLLEDYDNKVALAYIRGQFVNLLSGTVYYNFDRKLNNSNRELKEEDTLHIGIDFNVDNMSAITHVKDKDLPIAVDELIGAFDTTQLIFDIKNKYNNKRIYVYPDASGANRQTNNASTTDLQLLEQAGFYVVVNASNPRVRDRVNCMNAMFKNSKGERRYLVNVAKCPTYADNLEKQAWDGSEPDKKNGFDHTNDAGGYFITSEYPIEKPISNINGYFKR